ncbi:Subtilase family protein [Lysobacter enzymogenes]|nr:Subtilase family protein [Lysobacter enzymogenes]
MPNGHYPLLLFPSRAKAERSKLGGGAGGVNVPGIDRQRARIAPQLATLQQAFEAKRIQLQQTAPLENPELVLVLEVVGSVADFARAVRLVPGLEWLFELAEDQIAQDEDFYSEEENKRAELLSGRLYLLGSNQEALAQLIGLWNRYQQDPAGKFDRGLAPFKRVFAHLRTIRPWDVNDRVGTDVRIYWQDQVGSGQDVSRFEIEAWHFTAATKNTSARAEIEALVRQLGGRVLSSALISDIAYHGLLVELPTEAIERVLAGEVPALLLSDRIMFFRPKGQSMTDGLMEQETSAIEDDRPASERPPVIALFDGLPLSNHALLADRLIIDDPDGWEAGYEAKDRMHGTAMASLILHGELDGGHASLERKLYVRPIMRPDPNDGFHQRRREQTPNDVLLIDLIHRAVKRIFEGDAGQPPTAPTVRVINLSLGDSHRIFGREMSPWARLLDWLSHRYSVLFIVSAGNDPSPLKLETPRGSLADMTPMARETLAFAALIRANADRRLMAPAESINALTVGALHADDSPNIAIPNRFDLFAQRGLSPLSRVGHGYRRAIKPDVLMPGGRVLHMEQFIGVPQETVVELAMLSAKPGHRTATPALPEAGGMSETTYCRGTSNAAALTSRAAAQTYDMLEALRAQLQNGPGLEYDAVLLKALLVHGASWGDLSTRLLDSRPDLHAITDTNRRRIAQKDFVTRWLGHGPLDVERAITCTEQRATLLGFGELAAEEALLFSAPLPPGLAGTRAWRRVTITLAWMSPVNPKHHAYRRAKLWISEPGAELRVKRTNSVDDKAARRGTVQHEILEGEDAVAYVDGDRFVCKVNCAADAGILEGKVRFALCVSLEVAVDSGIRVYQEISERIAPPVGIRPA